jgi:cell division protein FtsI (penicillin-binding protein 3)
MSAAEQARRPTRFRVRLLFLALSMSVAVAAVAIRLAWLTVVDREFYVERGQAQYQKTLALDARRGAIRDRNGRELALSVDVESLYVVPTSFTPDEIPEASAKLSACLGVPRKRIAVRLKGARSFAWLERKADPEAARCVRALGLDGIGFIDESRRFYPKRSLAAQVLGYVGIDNEGMGGVEYALQDEIKGESGRRIIWTDALRRRAGSRIDVRSVPGRSVYLTLDENLQYITETELSKAVHESHAKSGIAILMRPLTGEILAMAAYPSFNPNRYGDSPESHRRNRSVTDVYEPGSTFKIVAASAALQEGLVTEDERIDCGRGSIKVGDRVIHDHSVFDVLTFREVVTRSSNVGMIRIGQRLGKSRLEDYVKAFGFGEPTGIELPAESRGILRPQASWGPVTAASIAFGQEVSVTPLQMLAAANVIATTGYLMRPRLVRGFGNPDGLVDPSLAPGPVRRVLDERTSERMRAILIGVVDEGTGRRAAIDGYRVAGKTGTAQKAVLGGYSKTDFIASFVGFAPASRPELTAIVILDSPEGDHSGSRAAAVFSTVVGRSLHYLRIPRDADPMVRVAKVWPQTPPILGAEALEPLMRPASFGLAAPEAREVSMAPDVLGLPARDALARFVASGLVPEIEGTGSVVGQSPSPGEPLEPGERARLVLGSGSAEPQPDGHAPGRTPRPKPGSDSPRVADVSYPLSGASNRDR